MDECINKQAVIEYFRKKADLGRKLFEVYGGDFGVEAETLYSVAEALVDFPAVDVAPVRYGRWEDGDPICPVCGEDKFKDLDADIWSDWKPSFCPNCGARMGSVDK